MKKRNSILLMAFLILIVSAPTYASFLKEDLIEITPNNPYLIYTEEDLKKIGNAPDWTLDKHYKLMNDIVLSKPIQGTSNWIPIGNSEIPFTGIFDGNNKVIKGMTITDEELTHIGFFGVIKGNNALIKNLGILDIFITTLNLKNGSTGGLVGKNDGGTLYNCYSKGKIEMGRGNIGGLIGINYGIVDHCYFSGNINNGYIVGGLVGKSEGIIKNSYAEINAHEGFISYIGGLVGEAFSLRKDSIIERSFSEGKIYGDIAAGGIVGIMSNVIIRDCFSLIDIWGRIDVGGIAAEALSGIIERCYFAGKLNLTIQEFSPSYMGGIVGIHNDTSIKNCMVLGIKTNYSASHVVFGNIAGYNFNGTFVNNQIISSNSLSMLSKNEIKDKFINQLIGWDFTSEDPVWKFIDQSSLPKLSGLTFFEKID